MANQLPISFLEFPHSTPSDEALLATPAPMHRVVELASLTEALASDASRVLSILLNNSVQREARAEDCVEDGAPLTPATEQALLRFMANTFHLLEREANAVASGVA
ncbi:hypothetical protein CEY09_05330 [Achromobacter marplatensis]|uniref:DUF3077 domain-containing protein n=1 Tax=Achromobacter marplatensis TaxID=470868 RepID=A0ABX9GE83_9BURK|nr:hypothetical protein [Achromobacter marplatensis]OWT70993.1 hypothetical protein CEY09_05330 [Achromobacter marplatensis]RBP22611.1 hypothetical protein DFP87_102353 [Achromobacter marplatensis]CAB3648675.1 hypothetical protein LMG26219_02639 [Achromobacter marplatensis]